MGAKKGKKDTGDPLEFEGTKNRALQAPTWDLGVGRVRWLGAPLSVQGCLSYSQYLH